MLYQRTKKRMSTLIVKSSQLMCATAVAVFLVSCGGSSGDTDATPSNGTGGGGIIGTGIQLEGTASSVRKFANNNIEIKARSGEKAVAQINASGRFIANDVGGTGPFLLRANMGNNKYLYSIAHESVNDEAAQNIHSYTDAAARNWFASNGYDIDAAFAGDTPITALPDAQTLLNIGNGFLAIVNDVLLEYDLPNIDLATVSYDANNTGVDLFLNNNPVLINNGTITILITDPDPESGIITQASSGVALTTDLTIDDVAPPSAPTSLRALPASMNEIVIVWDSAIDNIGVTAYQVFRDDVLIATTPFPVYTDTGLLANTQYTYTVVAIDSSANPSVASSPATSETLSQADNVAPPTPVSVMLSPGLNTFSVSWSQEQIFDVAAFNVYRSGSAEQSEATFKVTSDFITDATVLSGSQYCYQVSAVDASGNESPASDIQCAVTTGSVITTPDAPITSSDFLAPTVDVSGLSCTDVLSSTVSTDTVISAGCYLAPRGISVRSPANLTLNAGVVIKFGASSTLSVGNGASFTAIGTAVSPIIFSAVDPTPGFWSGVVFNSSNSSRNQLDFVQVEYAGSGGRAANIYASALSGSPSRVSIKNTTVRFGPGFGFYFTDNIILGAFEGNLMVDNESPLFLSADSAVAINDSSRYTGNTNDAVLVSDDDVNTATTLAKLSVPYLMESRIWVKNSLTIEPGVTMTFPKDGELLIGADGIINAVGTAIDPILLTGVDARRGSWHGVRFLFNSSQANTIEHTIIEYAGSGDYRSALTVLSFDQSPSRLAANHITLRESLGDGFNIGEGAQLTQFDNITSTLNAKTGEIEANVVHLIGPGASFLGNDVDQVSVRPNVIESDVTWLTHDAPYLINDTVQINAKMTLSPGSTLLMNSGAELAVGTDGALSAIGTAQGPILVTGEQAIPGYWNGISFFRSASLDNRLEYVTIEYGGAGFSPTAGGNITMRCVSIDPTRLTLENVNLNFSRSWGINADVNDCEVTLGQNVTYMGNGVGGFNLMP